MMCRDNQLQTKSEAAQFKWLEAIAHLVSFRAPFVFEAFEIC